MGRNQALNKNIDNKVTEWYYLPYSWCVNSTLHNCFYNLLIALQFQSTELVDGPLWSKHVAYRKQMLYRGADKSLARPERKQATATEDFYFHISYL
jgi:hypothetical protein